jgi:hypothetical protein
VIIFILKYNMELVPSNLVTNPDHLLIQRGGGTGPMKPGNLPVLRFDESTTASWRGANSSG